MVYYLKLYAVVFSLLLYSIPLTAQIKKTVTAKNKLESKIMISSDTSYLRGERVHLLDSSFLLPGIDQALRIWVYLPKNYKSSKKNYPVIYFPEGSNVFNKKNELMLQQRAAHKYFNCWCCAKRQPFLFYVFKKK